MRNNLCFIPGQISLVEISEPSLKMELGSRELGCLWPCSMDSWPAFAYCHSGAHDPGPPLGQVLYHQKNTLSLVCFQLVALVLKLPPVKF